MAKMINKRTIAHILLATALLLCPFLALGEALQSDEYLRAAIKDNWIFETAICQDGSLAQTFETHKFIGTLTFRDSTVEYHAFDRSCGSFSYIEDFQILNGELLPFKERIVEKTQCAALPYVFPSYPANTPFRIEDTPKGKKLIFQLRPTECVDKKPGELILRTEQKLS